MSVTTSKAIVYRQMRLSRTRNMQGCGGRGYYIDSKGHLFAPALLSVPGREKMVSHSLGRRSRCVCTTKRTCWPGNSVLCTIPLTRINKFNSAYLELYATCRATHTHEHVLTDVNNPRRRTVVLQSCDGAHTRKRYETANIQKKRTNPRISGPRRTLYI